MVVWGGPPQHAATGRRGETMNGNNAMALFVCSLYYHCHRSSLHVSVTFYKVVLTNYHSAREDTTSLSALAT